MRNLNLILLAATLVLALSSPGPVVNTSPVTELLAGGADGALACTSFCLDNGGYCVFGANQDNDIDQGLLVVKPRGMLKTSWEPGTTGVYARWISKYGSLTVDYAGLEMAWAGMNEAGLMMSTMALGGTEDPHPDERPPLVTPLWMQYQLDNHATIEEVIASDADVRITGGVDHYLVCDGSGACATIEFLEGRMVTHSGDSLPVSALANSRYERSLTVWWAGAPDTKNEGHSYNRFSEAADAVVAFEPATPEGAVQAAFDTLAEVALPNNAWRLVFDPAGQQVHVWTHVNPAVRTIELAQLDLSCGAPRLVLEIDAGQAGDVSTEFRPMAHRASVEYTNRFMAARGQADQYPPFLVDILLRGVESFRCAGSAGNEDREAGVLFADYRPWLPPTVSWAARSAAARLWPVWLGLVLLSLVVVVRRMPRDLPPSLGRRAAWLAGVAILGPLGLLGYTLAHRSRP
jgi:choloylglycine hydrolase